MICKADGRLFFFLLSVSWPLLGEDPCRIVHMCKVGDYEAGLFDRVGRGLWHGLRRVSFSLAGWLTDWPLPFFFCFEGYAGGC